MIYHVLTASDWAEAKRSGSVRPASLELEGFVHCSTDAQVSGVVRRFYAAVPDLWLLWVDQDQLDAELRWEAPAHPAPVAPGDEPPAGDPFPHIYGPLNLSAVLDATPWDPTLFD